MLPMQQKALETLKTKISDFLLVMELRTEKTWFSKNLLIKDLKKFISLSDQELFDALYDQNFVHKLSQSIRAHKKKCKVLTFFEQNYVLDEFDKLADEIAPTRMELLRAPPFVREQTLMEIFNTENKEEGGFLNQTLKRLSEYSYTAFNLTALFEPQDDDMLSQFKEIIRAFVSHTYVAYPLFACELLINLDDNEFKQLLEDSPDIFVNIRKTLKDKTTLAQLLPLITLESRILGISKENESITEAFIGLRCELNTKKTGHEKLDMSKLEGPLSIIKKNAPGWLTRLINYLCSSRKKYESQSFFEKESAGTLFEKVKIISEKKQ